MNTLTLLTAADCHLCAHGREVLDALAAEGLVTWREVDADSAEGARLAAAAPPLRPVLIDGTGRVIAYGRLSQRHLVREFGRARLAGEPSTTRKGHRPSGHGRF
jgi:hypothetical protein